MSEHKYDPVECLQKEVDRFKRTNTFTPMEVTGFYIQAAVVLDELARERELNAKLTRKLEHANKRRKVLREALEMWECETCNDTLVWSPECGYCLTGEPGPCKCHEQPDDPCPQCVDGPYRKQQLARSKALEDSD